MNYQYWIYAAWILFLVSVVRIAWVVTETIPSYLERIAEALENESEEIYFEEGESDAKD